MRMVALKHFRYAARRLNPGDQFDAGKRDAELLRLMKRAREAPVEPVRSEPVKAAPTYQRRDMQAEPLVASPAGDIAALRAAYFQRVGKRPFMGWDAATLREKIEAAR